MNNGLIVNVVRGSLWYGLVWRLETTWLRHQFWWIWGIYHLVRSLSCLWSFHRLPKERAFQGGCLSIWIAIYTLWVKECTRQTHVIEGWTSSSMGFRESYQSGTKKAWTQKVCSTCLPQTQQYLADSQPHTADWLPYCTSNKAFFSPTRWGNGPDIGGWDVFYNLIVSIYTRPILGCSSGGLDIL